MTNFVNSSTGAFQVKQIAVTVAVFDLLLILVNIIRTTYHHLSFVVIQFVVNMLYILLFCWFFRKPCLLFRPGIYPSLNTSTLLTLTIYFPSWHGISWKITKHFNSLLWLVTFHLNMAFPVIFHFRTQWQLISYAGNFVSCSTTTKMCIQYIIY